jgi:SET domain-containing protein
MLLVKTLLRPSSIQGLGLFADQLVRARTPVWRFTPGFDLRISPAQLSSLPKEVRAFFGRFGYRSPTTGQYILCSDHYRHVNHSRDAANVGPSEAQDAGEPADVALRDIQPGDELTIDYRHFGEDPT